MCKIPVVARAGDNKLIVGKSRAPSQMCREVGAHLGHSVTPVWLEMPRSHVGSAAFIEALASALSAVSVLTTPQSGTVRIVTVRGPVPGHADIRKIAARVLRQLVRDQAAATAKGSHANQADVGAGATAAMSPANRNMMPNWLLTRWEAHRTTA